MLDTWTSFLLVSRPETVLTTGAGSQPSTGARAVGTVFAAAALATRAASTNCRIRGDPGRRVGLGHGRGELGAGEPVPALRVVLGAQADREPDGEPVDRGALPLVVAAEPADHRGK